MAAPLILLKDGRQIVRIGNSQRGLPREIMIAHLLATIRVRSSNRWLAIALLVAPAMGVIYTAASWLRFYLTGSLILSPGLAMNWNSGIATIALAILGVCCLLAYRSVELGDLPRILKCSLLVHVFLLFAIPLQDTDFFVYLGYGTLVAHGLNPHRVGIAALGNTPLADLSPWGNMPSVYGPVATLVSAVGGFVGEWAHSPIWANGVTYKLLSGCLDLSCLFLAFAVARRAATASAGRGFAAFALNPLVAASLAAQGHNDVLIILSSLGFIWAVQRNRQFAATVVLTLGTMAKFVLGPPLALYLFLVGRQSLRRALLLGAISLALSCALIWPWWSNFHSLLLILWPVDQQQHTIYSAASIHWFIFKIQQRIHMPDRIIWSTFQAFSLLRWMIVLLLFSALTWRASTTSIFRVFEMVLVSIVATATWLMDWYFLWPLPFAIVETDQRWQRLILASTLIAALVPGPFRLVLIQPVVQLSMLCALFVWRAWNLEGVGLHVVLPAQTGRAT